MQPVHLEGERVVGIALEPVGDQQHDRALAEHAPRPVLVEVMQRRGDAGAARPVEHAGRAGGERLVRIALACSARVTLVSRVPNRNVCTRLRASVTRMEEMQEQPRCTGSSSRRYPAAPRSAAAWSSARDISGRSTRRRAFMLARNVRRMSMHVAVPVRRAAAACVTSSSGSTSRLIASLAAAISAAVICAKSFFCSTSRSDTVRRASSSISLLLLGLSSMPENSASCTRCAPASGGCRGALRRLRQHHRHQLVDIAAPAEKDAERLVEHASSARAASRTLHAASSRNPRACRRRRPSPLRAHRAPRPDRPECRPRAARGRSRRCFRRGGRRAPPSPRVRAPPRRGRPTRGSLRRANIPQPARPSSRKRSSPAAQERPVHRLSHSAARSSDFTSSSISLTFVPSSRAMSS